ncbi:hypothetical protein SAM23877_4377 [Streptomyces ambofaciens ATCC 23877]|uniref:Uncharacterized protein n=1 Tax=Streptomyces ambofaciens (strain ATCC 23877 / 3486 / DSM 40053 / JCM 4204 / NBRC 12836 / NRRL B-2516) TaxID=278992 RepID=A0A0K2AX67_STRA7|nr:hypothetical protein SAM23877_4377 [Streptomyces ambofaciens ATCC 23877]
MLQQWAGDPRFPEQAAARSRLDVRPRRGTVRPDERRALARPGPGVAQGGRQSRRRPPRAEGPRPRGRHGDLLPALRPHRRLRRPVRLLPRHAPGGQGAAQLAAVHRGRRDQAAVRRRRLRRGHHLLRAAQRAGHGRRAARDVPGDAARRPGRHLRVLAPDLDALPDRLHRVPDARPAAGGPRGVVQPRRVRLPRRVHPRLARPAGARPAAGRGRLVQGGVPEPDGRRGGAAPRVQGELRAARRVVPARLAPLPEPAPARTGHPRLADALAPPRPKPNRRYTAARRCTRRAHLPAVPGGTAPPGTTRTCHVAPATRARFR